MNNLISLIIENTSKGKIEQSVASEIVKKLLKNQNLKVETDIAIVGMALRVPGAETTDQFWDNLVCGKKSIDVFPEGRVLDAENLIKCVNPGREKIEFSRGGYLTNIKKFDYEFFKLSPKEAKFMDPNQRMFLKVAYETIEDAGYTKEDLNNTKTGVFVGNTAWPLYAQYIVQLQSDDLSTAMTGNVSSVLASRISYMMNLKGPSVVIDTACSSSLVAVHLACQSIINGECEQAIAGGIKLNLFHTEGLVKIGIESEDSETRTFDDNADGTVWGEGVAAIFIKPLSKAIKNNDHIYAVIKGSSINQDGTTVGIAAPNAKSQEDVITNAWRNSNIDPENIGYVECHGTGTKLGDPIEVQSLQRAFRKFTKKNDFCAIGSVKPNIGHLDNAAGIVSLIKSALVLENKKIPPLVNFKNLNNNIDFSNSPCFINTEMLDLKKENNLCGVSAFGLSGTNCHVVLGGYNNKASDSQNLSENIFCISAKSAFSMKKLVKKYLEYLDCNYDVNIGDLCYTVNARKNHLKEYRAVLIVSNVDQLKKQLIFLLDDIEVCQGKNFLDCFQSDRINENLAKIKDLYLTGNEIDWNEFYKNSNFKKIKVPLYQFDEKDCWVNVPSNYKFSKAEPSSQKDENFHTFSLCGRKDGFYTDNEKFVGELWSKVLGYEKLDINKNFYELGGDSIAIMKIVSGINEKLGTNLALNEFIQNCTIHGVAQLLPGQMIKSASDDSEIKIIHREENQYEPFSLTNIQLAYFIGRSRKLNMGGVSTHVYTEIETDMDIERFNLSLNKVIVRHPTLRSIVLENGMQKVLDDVPIYKVDYVDLSEKTPDQQKAILLNERNRMSHFVFKTDRWPLFEFKAFKLSIDKSYLLVGFDMLIGDGYSIQIVTNEIIKFYKNPDLKLPTIKYSFKDYLEAYEKLKNSDKYKKAKQYWLEKVPNFPSYPKLPFIKKVSEIKVPKFSRISKSISKEKYEALKRYATTHEVSISVLLCTVYLMVLSYWSNQKDLSISLTIFNRYPFHPDVEKIVGDFTSVIALDGHFGDSISFVKALKNVQKTLIQALENKLYDGVELIRELSKFDGSSSSITMPIVFTSLLFGDSNKKDLEDTNILGKIMLSVSQTPQVFLDCQVSEHNGNLNINWDYIQELFGMSLINKVFESYISFLDRIIENKIPDDFGLSLEDDRILKKYNNTQSVIVPKTLHDGFLSQSVKTPENVAVSFNGENLTYRELSERSLKVANWLIDNGISLGDFVAVSGERNIETIVNIFGILRAGAAYVPIDPDYPQGRKDYIYNNSRCKIFLESNLFETCGLENYSTTNELPEVEPENVAYVIYTSGSTGTPKGVVITHKAAWNTIYDINKKFSVTQSDRCLAISSLSFDLSVYDVFGTLGVGATLYLLADKRDIVDVVDQIKKNSITIVNSVPAIAGMIVDYVNDKEVLSSVRLTLLSGDWIPVNLPRKIKQKLPSTKVISLGGATEASIWSIYYPIEEQDKSWKSIPYGMPLANQRFYVLNYKNQNCPVGVPGELYIAGDGLAEGYLNDEEKTEKSFVQHPNLGRLYKTGDLGVMNRSGYIEFLGRKDFQVKIRGYRIELGEIESVLLKFPNIKNVMVTDKSDKNGKKYLCAYYISNFNLEISDLQNHLKKFLPEYMMPAHFIKLEKFPVSANGKINKKALPDPVLVDASSNYEKPQNAIQNAIFKIWSKVLGVEKIGINDNFFEIGGDSILLMKVYSQIDDIYPNKIKVVDLFAYTTISQIAKYICDSDRQEEKNISLIPLKILKKDLALDSENKSDVLGFDLKASIDDLTINGINKIAKINGLDIVDVFLIVYCYILFENFEMSSGSKLQVSTMLNEQEQLGVFEINLNLATSFEELFEIFLKSKNSMESIYADTLSKYMLKKESNEIFPLIFDKKITSKFDLTDYYDLLLELDESKNYREITLKYNSHIIKAESAKTFLNQYLNLLKSIINKILTDRGKQYE